MKRVFSWASMGVATFCVTLSLPAYAHAQRGNVNNAPVVLDSLYPYHPGVNVRAYDFRIELPARGSDIRGYAAVIVRRSANVDTLRLDLLDMTVDAVKVGAEARAFRRDSARIHIPFLATDGTDVTFVVQWHGVPKDGLIIREDSVRGWSAFGDNWPNRARHWLPTVDHPSDKALVNWEVIAPSGLSVVANGVQLSSGPAQGPAGFIRTRFAMRQPIPTYLMVIGVARMHETPLGPTACGAGIDGGCVPQSVWTFPQETTYAPGPFAFAGAMIEYFARTAGSYPYERLAHLQSATRFGGMENATAIFYSDNAFRQRNVGLGLIAHETAHQWFGDAVTPRRWQDLWLSEGFASYWAPLFLREAQGDSVFRAQLREMRETIIAAKVVSERPVVDTIGAAEPLTLLNANSYQKGGWVLHVLRAEVGDSAFFNAVREYQRVYQHGTATTSNFIQLVERAAGRSLQTFATQWLHQPGWAELDLRATWDDSSKRLSFAVTQQRFDPYPAPLTLLLRDATGKEVRVRLDIAARNAQTIDVPVAGIGKPVEIIADPDVMLLGRVRVSY